MQICKYMFFLVFWYFVHLLHNTQVVEGNGNGKSSVSVVDDYDVLIPNKMVSQL